MINNKEQYRSPYYSRLELLTLNEIKEETLRCKNIENGTGFLYFLLNYVKMSHAAHSVAPMYEHCYDWQFNASKKFISKKQIISKKPRQVGFSSVVGAYCLWRALFFKTQNIAIVSISLRESKTFLDRIKFIYDNLPYWMRAEKVEDQKTSFTFKETKSKITSLPMTSNPGRGDSLSLLVLDEFATYKNQSDTLAAAIPSLATGFGIPFTNNSLPSQLFIISTYPSNPVENEYIRILNEARTREDSSYEVVDVSTTDIPHYQDENWHREMLTNLGLRRYNIEVKGIEPSDAENSFLPEYILTELEAASPKRCDFLYQEMINEEGYPKDINMMSMIEGDFDMNFAYIKNLWVWEDPVPNKEYVMVCDVSAGHGGDHSAFIILDPETNAQVAEFTSNKVTTEVFKDIIEVVARYYNNAKLSIENNGVGVTICDYFGNRIQYENFYFTRKSKSNYVPGFSMNTATRANGIAFFGSMMQRREFNIKSLRLINQLRAFGYKPSGRIEGMGNSKDDLVMCLVQFCYLQNIGWAVSSGQSESQLIFGSVEEEKKDIIHIKYYDNTFDIDPEELDFHRQELLRIIQQNGDALTPDVLNYLHKDYY